MIDTGAVSEGDLVITETGLAGIVTGKGQNFAEAASLLDPGFAVGVRVLKTGEPGLAAGDFSLMDQGCLAIELVNGEAGLAEGDFVETSGSGSPEGILVGRVVRMENGFALAPIADLSRLRDVFVVTEW
jgi:cell shape-determining protein MreC